MALPAGPESGPRPRPGAAAGACRAGPSARTRARPRRCPAAARAPGSTPARAAAPSASPRLGPVQVSSSQDSTPCRHRHSERARWARWPSRGLARCGHPRPAVAGSGRGRRPRPAARRGRALQPRRSSRGPRRSGTAPQLIPPSTPAREETASQVRRQPGARAAPCGHKLRPAAVPTASSRTAPQLASEPVRRVSGTDGSGPAQGGAGRGFGQTRPRTLASCGST